MDDIKVVMAAALKGFKLVEVREDQVENDVEKSNGVCTIEYEDNTKDTFAVVFVPSLNRHMAVVPTDMVDTFNSVFGWEQPE
jgi:hypothetical protein